MAPAGAQAGRPADLRHPDPHRFAVESAPSTSPQSAGADRTMSNSRFLACLISWLLLASPASARYYVDGQALGKLMAEYEKVQQGAKDADPELAGQYLGYIRGVTDVYDYKVCVPNGTADEALAAVVTKYLKAHRNKWYRPALTLVYASIQEAYPCP